MKNKIDLNITKNDIKTAIEFVTGLINQEEKEQVLIMAYDKITSVEYIPENCLLSNDEHQSENNIDVHLWEPDNCNFPLPEYTGNLLDLDSEYL